MPEGSAPGRTRFGRRFLALFGLGMVGVLALPLIILPQAEQLLAASPGVELSPTAIALLSLINPTILLAIGVAIGVRLAPALGLRSYLDERVAFGAPILRRLTADLPKALSLGVVGGIVLILLDLGFQPLLDAGPGAVTEGRDWRTTLLGLLYGGITEELLMRWGLMSLLAWLGWRIAGRRGERPGDTVMWAAVLIAAVLFGVGHLPALAATTPLTPLLIVRTVGLNAIGGVLFGWLFWRRSLEAAMVAHGAFHLTFTAASWIV